jgi:hypothetical protein
MNRLFSRAREIRIVVVTLTLVFVNFRGTIGVMHGASNVSFRSAANSGHGNNGENDCSETHFKIS